MIARARCPGSASWSGVLSPPLRYVVVPLAVAVLGTQAAPDGRAAHRFALDWLRLRLRARRRSAGRVVPLEGEPVPLARRAGGALGRRRGAAASRAGARAGAGDVQRAGRAAVAAGRLIARADREGARPGRGRAVRRRRCWRCGRDRLPAALRASEHPRRPRRRARGAVPAWTTVSYPFLAAADKREWLRRLARFAFAVEADFSLWRVCRAYPAERYAEQAEALLDARQQSPAAWRSYLRGHEAHLRELRSFVPEVYLAVSLAAERPGGPLRGMDRVRRRVEELFGVAATLPIAASEIEALIVAEERAFRRARGVPAGAAGDDARAAVAAAPRRVPRRRRAGAGRSLGAERADRRDRRRAAGVRAAGHRPGAARQRADPRAGPRAGRSTPRRAARIQALLGMGALPEESEFPGGAELLFAPLEALAFPVDAVLHARWLGNREAITPRAPADRRRRRRLLRAADLGARAAVVRGRGEPAARARARRLPAVARAAAAAADARSRWRSARRRARSSSAASRRCVHRFGTVALHRPLGLQPALFLDHLPRADGGTVRDYADVLTIEQFGALMPVGTHQAGSERGVYIGRTRDRRRAAGALRHHRGLAHGAAAVDPAGRHARVGQDDRRRAARASRPSGAAAWSSTSTPSPITTSRACRSSTGACT